MIEHAGPRPCKAMCKSGAACRMPCVSGSEYCFTHDPALAARRKEACSRGGRARHGRKLGPLAEGEYVTINDLGDVVRIVERELNEVLHLDRSISRARAVGYLCGIVSGIYKDSELEARLAALEAQAGLVG